MAKLGNCISKDVYNYFIWEGTKDNQAAINFFNQSKYGPVCMPRDGELVSKYGGIIYNLKKTPCLIIGKGAVLSGVHTREKFDELYAVVYNDCIDSQDSINVRILKDVTPTKEGNHA